MFDFRHWSVWVAGIGMALAAVALLEHIEFGTASAVMTFASVDPSPQPGNQIVAAVILSETCGFSRQPNLLNAIPRVLNSLATLAHVREKSFVTVGIAVNSYPRIGASFLQGIYDFDEVSHGGSWAVLGAFRYMWQDLSGNTDLPHVSAAQIGVPQVVVTRRVLARGTLDDSTAASSPSYYRIVDERVLGRFVGVRAIREFDPAVIERAIGPVSEATSHDNPPDEQIGVPVL